MKEKIKIILKKHIVSFFLKLLYSTNTYDVRGRENYIRAKESGKSIIISLWHSQLLSVFYDLKDIKVYALAGTHKDAEIISQVALKWGWNMIRGSSKEDGAKAYKEILKILKSGQKILFITPDGPTGPAKVPKLGIIRAAKKTGTIIIPASTHSTRRWGFTNWDTFFLEKPFGKIYIKYGKPLLLEDSISDTESSRKLVEAMEQVELKNLHYANKK